MDDCEVGFIIDRKAEGYIDGTVVTGRRVDGDVGFVDGVQVVGRTDDGKVETLLDGKVVAVADGTADCVAVELTDGVMVSVGAVDGTKEGQMRGVTAR